MFFLSLFFQCLFLGVWSMGGEHCNGKALFVLWLCIVLVLTVLAFSISPYPETALGLLLMTLPSLALALLMMYLIYEACRRE